ncbi:MAG TPA: ABC transporter ATP-binding protein [Polyangia bacterium]|nr:ABC transporter ATP-binding protein [Polyangia bacterium]
MPASPAPARDDTSLTLPGRMRPEAGRVAAGALALAATNGLALAIPWLLKNAIDALRAGGAAAHGAVARDAALIAVFAVLQGVIRTSSRVLIFNAARNIEYVMRRDVFHHLVRLDAAFFRRSATGDVMSRLTNDLGAVRGLFGPGVLNVVNSTIIYASTLFLLVRLSPALTLYALLPYPLLLVLARLSGRVVFRASREIQEQLGHMSTSIQEDLAGVAVVKHYGLEELRHRRFRALNDAYLERSLRLVRARGVLGPLFAMLAGTGTLIVLWAGGRQVIAGRLTLGALVAFNAYVVALSWPTIALGWIISLWQRGVAGWARVRELLESEPRVRDAAPDAALTADALEPSIEVRGLTVALDDRRLLDDVSFSVPAGTTLAIVGPTGAGKTTLVDALVRLQDVAPGAVSVGGHDVTRLPLARLRGLFGYAPQDPFLFSATVAENIAFGVRDAAALDEATLRARVVRAGEAAGLAPDVAVLPDGWDTLVGERGITLSGGQRQRVALARALASDPRVLMLDDTLSSVDAQTEREILTRLAPILRERTSIVVSHRVAAVKGADQILVLDAGRVAERGTHAALLAAGGLYASLYREQLAAEQLAEDAA